ncbi:hypothetical protein Golob_006311 [Gossypium lobatum]|uniref:Uncharacterized protein n=1 Tax=Gossypium lobatum TaxID=34289 RepID=A0A7J8MW33_9ROSI|nr:hypothetical protein [Gossypium lobatum]
MSEGVARQFGNFIGQFLEYDVALVTKGVKKLMRIRIRGRGLEGYQDKVVRNAVQANREIRGGSRWGLGSDVVKGVDLRMEEMPIEFVARKKRQWV